MTRYFWVLVASLVCSACQSYYADEVKLEHQKMLIDPYSSEHVAKHGDGFVVTMKQSDAIKMNAPASPEFAKMLEDQLAVEKSLGHSYCPFGYEVKTMTHFSHSHTTVEIDCKPGSQTNTQEKP